MRWTTELCTYAKSFMNWKHNIRVEYLLINIITIIISCFVSYVRHWRYAHCVAVRSFIPPRTIKREREREMYLLNWNSLHSKIPWFATCTRTDRDLFAVVCLRSLSLSLSMHMRLAVKLVQLLILDRISAPQFHSLAAMSIESRLFAHSFIFNIFHFLEIGFVCENMDMNNIYHNGCIKS